MCLQAYKRLVSEQHAWPSLQQLPWKQCQVHVPCHPQQSGSLAPNRNKCFAEQGMIPEVRTQDLDVAVKRAMQDEGVHGPAAREEML